MTLAELEEKYPNLNCFEKNNESIISIGHISINFRTDKSFEELLNDEHFLNALDLMFISLKNQFYIIDSNSNIKRA
jgi:hypothetical protein